MGKDRFSIFHCNWEKFQELGVNFSHHGIEIPNLRVAVLTGQLIDKIIKGKEAA